MLYALFLEIMVEFILGLLVLPPQDAALCISTPPPLPPPPISTMTSGLHLLQFDIFQRSIFVSILPFYSDSGDEFR